MHLEIAGPAGRIEALLDEPAASRPARCSEDAARSPRAAVVLAHPHPLYGGSMHTKAVYQAAKGLTRIGCAVLRFNFRGVGTSEGDFDDGRGERDDFRAALEALADRYPGAPHWAAGLSFGSWIALETGAADPRVSLLIAIAPPVKRENYDWTNTLGTDKPKFFIQGDLDDVCPLKDLWAFYARLKEPKELVVIDGASHLFDGKTQEVGEALEDLLGDLD